MNAFDDFKKTLDQLTQQHQRRYITQNVGIDFTSNDYLGLNNHPALTAAAIDALASGIPVGAGASRLLRGNHPAIDQLENNAAKHFGSEAALFVHSGFIANFLLMTTLPTRFDAIVFDAEIHASLKEGIHAGHASSYKVAHNSLDAYEDALKRAREKNARHIWLVVESIYSMSGDRAPLAELDVLAQRYDAILIIDEAHATGVFGEAGIGLSHVVKHAPMITVRTCGKALGSSGALIGASQIVIDYLINQGRPFIYSTAPSPLNAHIVDTAIALQAKESWRQKQLHQHMQNLSKALGKKIDTPIIPIILGNNARTLKIATQLQSLGLDIRAIRPPTVAENAAQLRITLHTHNTSDELNTLIKALETL